MSIAELALLGAWALLTWHVLRSGRRQRKRLDDAERQIAALVDAIEERELGAPLEAVYRSAGIDPAPSRRELDRRLCELEQKPTRLPMLPTGRYCVDCVYSFIGDGGGMGCHAHPAEDGFRRCGDVNRKHDCKHFRVRSALAAEYERRARGTKKGPS